jgi:2-furoyl-CoA dehydrogenase FAD binding subunit
VKAAPFDYVRPATVTEAVAALAEAGDDAKVLAGGQSLVPVLAMRLGRPTLLVDINAVEGLDDLSLTDDALHVGAMVRQRRVEHDPAAAAVPLLAMALPWIGHRELRSRGTVCGSLAHADPAAELPAVAACLNATLEIAAPSGRRTVHARDFFLGPLTTVLAPDELLLAAHFPAATPGDGFAFAELSRRHGDYALTGVAVRVRQMPSGEIQEAVLAAFAISGRPVVIDITDHLTTALSALPPGAPAEVLVRALTPPMSALADERVDTPGDMHASNAYRRRLFTHLAARELAHAHLRAKADRVREPTGVRSSPGGSRTSSAPARKCPANQSSVTEMKVNGKQVTVTAPPRMTLADALRDRLGLKGTHLGCEHGICGTCTVLVDGQAARSCLLFACQLDGAEVLTVEGLGRPGELHPLQQAFGRHHALQCGFCTPGFLLSAYDLLRHRPEVRQDELAAELSGVLCRCTGYRNILSAVAEVARTHPDGPPAPLNCVRTALRYCRRSHGRRRRRRADRRGRIRRRRRGDRSGWAGGGRHGDGRQRAGRGGRGDGRRCARGHRR